MEIIMALATVAMAVTAVITAIYAKTQTKIQEQNVKISLLQQRVECINALTEVNNICRKNALRFSYEFLADPDYGKKLFHICDRFGIAKINSQFLFDQSIQEAFIGIFENFNSMLEQLCTDSEKMNTISDENRRQAILLAIQYKSDLQDEDFKKKIKELIGYDFFESYITAQQNLEKLFTGTLFEDLKKYVDVQSIGRVK